MIRLTDTQRAQILACPDLSPRERAAADLIYGQRLSTADAAQRLALNPARVLSLLSRARKRVCSPKPKREPLARPPLSVVLEDPGWWTRNTDMVRSLAHDPDHQERYLHCLDMLFGAEVSAQIRERAGA